MVVFSEESLLDLLQTDSTWVVKVGVPADAKIVSAARDASINNLVLYVESAEFEPLALGQAPPVHDVTFTRPGVGFAVSARRRDR